MSYFAEQFNTDYIFRNQELFSDDELEQYLFECGILDDEEEIEIEF
jgi:hypothetical protein